MTPLVSQYFRGPVLTADCDLAPGRAVLGRPAWTAEELLRNLELQLGLPHSDADEAIRVQHWSRRLSTLSRARPRFYSASYESDPLGAAKLLLAQRDELRMAGWSGAAVPNAGARLETFVELEALGAKEELSGGLPDRLELVLAEVEAARVRCFDVVELAERRETWPALWRRVFELLEQAGTPVTAAHVSFPVRSGESDLHRVQALLRGEGSGPVELTGDGSLVLLTGETSWELGRAVAARLRALRAQSCVVLRGGDLPALEGGLSAEGLPSQGLRSLSEWRPVLQVLPLALELAFEPRDPARVLELLTLSEGPFHGVVGRELAMALREMPGIGGQPWAQAKQRLAELDASRQVLERVSAWLEAPGYAVGSGAPREALREVVGRVSGWLSARLAAVHAALGASERDHVRLELAGVLAEAASQARTFGEALQHDPRAALTLVEARQLLEEVGAGGHLLVLRGESAGRIDHVAAPACLRVQRDVVVWWHCALGTEWRPSPTRWRRAELEALGAAGVHFVRAEEQLMAAAASFRRVVLAARESLILVLPRTACGDALTAHPIWDEIVARTGADEPALARVTVDVRDGLAACAELSPLELPEPRAHWILPRELVRVTGGRHSASSLEALVGCPLRWVLRYQAELYPSSGAGLPSGPILMGKLAHRLVEELHTARELAGGELQARAARHLHHLFATEAASLLQPGLASERAQLETQLCRAVELLGQLLAEAELSLVGVEVETEAAWRHGTAYGRIDLLVRDVQGRELILDLKWGARRYRELLSSGNALQLATYAALRRAEGGSELWPAAGYLSVADAQIHATNESAALGRRGAPLDGPSLAETWHRLEAHASHVIEELSSGRVSVTGLGRSLPVVETAPTAVAADLLALEPGAACKYCDYGPICGRSWEGFR